MKLPEDFHFSQSNLQDYVDCPYRFYLRYFLRLKWPALVVDDARAFERRGQIGARFHRLIQQYLQGVPESRISDLASADPEPELSRWWEDFLLYVIPNIEGERFVEATLSTTLSGHLLLAKFDLVLLGPDGDLTIFDWKTSHRKPRQEWLLQRLQTRLYRLVLANAHQDLTGGQLLDPNHITMQYWFTTHPQNPISLPYTTDAYHADQIYLERMVQDIAQREEARFLRTEDLEKCRYCVYRSHCDRGEQAGELAGYEDFSSGIEDYDQDIEFDQIAEIAF
jgi:RecB family exonuclease